MQTFPPQLAHSHPGATKWSPAVSWSGDDDNEEAVGTWDGVEALEQKDGQAVVTALMLPNRRISGSLETLRGLSSLVALVLPDNALTGPVTGLSDCRCLEVLTFSLSFFILSLLMVRSGKRCFSTSSHQL